MAPAREWRYVVASQVGVLAPRRIDGERPHHNVLAVHKGKKRPWQVRPYATWELKLPFGSARIGGAAYDPAARLIYLSQQYADGAEPVIHVFNVR
jgi:hypothetical protein